jgi:hypothetical protein
MMCRFGALWPTALKGVLTGANPDDDQQGGAALIEASERRLASFCFACSF